MTLPPLSPNAWLRWDVVSRLLPASASVVLEIGCGQGGFAVRLAQRYRYVGLEPDSLSYHVANERLELSQERRRIAHVWLTERDRCVGFAVELSYLAVRINVGAHRMRLHRP